MPAPDFRFPPGFDPRADLLLDFEVGFDEHGRRQELVRLAGALELPAAPLRAPDAKKLIKRLSLAHCDALETWLLGADDARRLVLRHSPGSAAAWWKWEQIKELCQGRVGLVRCIQGLEAGEPKRPGSALRALVVIADPRQPERNEPINGELASLLAGISAALAESGVGSLTVAASMRWAKAARGNFMPFETGEDLLKLLRTGWDVLHIVSHGDPPAQEAHPMLEAGSLRLEEGPGLCFEDLASALADGPTQLLTVQACHGGPRMAELLLRAVPHVLLFREEVGAAFSSRFASHFYQALFRTRLSVPAAVATARQGSAPFEAWIPAHFAADLARPVILDAAAHEREAYLRRVRDHCQRMQGLRLFEEDPRLQDLYIELHLESRRGQDDEQRSEPWIDTLQRRGGNPLTLESLLELTSASGVTGKWVLLGDPGAGKSTTLRALAHHFALAGGFVPILIRLPDWPRRNGEGELPGLEAFERHFESYVIKANLGSPRAEPHERIVLLDGLDECSDPNEHLEAFLGNIKAARVVVATRELQYADRIPQTFLRVHLKPLEREQQLELLTNLFQIDARRHPGDWKDRSPAQEAKTLLLSLRGQLKLAAKTPFILSLLALMRARGQGSSAGGSRFEVLQQALHILILGEHRNRGDRSRLLYVEDNRPSGKVRKAALDPLAAAYAVRSRGLLREVAFRSTVERKDLFQTPELERWLCGSAEGMPGASFLSDYTIPDSGLLNLFQAPGPRNLPCNTYEFAHRVLREALTAEYLAETYPGLEALQEFVDARLPGGHPELVNEWAEPLALLTGTLPQADQVAWVHFLQYYYPDLGLRVLANAELEPAVVAQLLIGAENRGLRRVYCEGLFETMDPGYVLPLLDLLLAAGGHATDVRDLAHLDRLARALAGRHPSHSPEIALARERLLEKLPVPSPEALEAHFSKVPGRPDNLWAVVPPGSFPMGRDVDQHGQILNPGIKTRITRPFAIARVPVTLGQYRLFDPTCELDAKTSEYLPVYFLEWSEADLFCRWLERYGGGLRRLVLSQLGVSEASADQECYRFCLPTEAEWEYACRDGGLALTRFVTGNSEADLDRVAVCWNQGGERPDPVASKDPSPVLSLWDMHGNVFEWCADLYEDGLVGGDDPTGPPERPDLQAHVRRGGAYWDGGHYCRSASRGFWNGVYYQDHLDWGFRVVLAPRAPRR